MNGNDSDLMKRIDEDDGPGGNLRRDVAQWLDGRRNFVLFYMVPWVAVGAVLVCWGVQLLVMRGETRYMLIGLALALFGLEINVLVKLWYWIVDSKLNLLKELKLMQIEQCGETGELSEADLERVIPESFFKRRGRCFESLSPKTARWLSTALVVAPVFVAAPGGAAFIVTQLGHFSAGVSQEDLWRVEAGGVVAVESRLDCQGYPVKDSRFLTIELPVADAILESVSANGVPLPVSALDWRRYEVELPIRGFGQCEFVFDLVWRFPLDAMYKGEDGYRIPLQALLPVDGYTVVIEAAPDSGFHVTTTPDCGFQTAGPGGEPRVRPFYTERRCAERFFGSCSMMIEADVE